ncbi:MAG: RNA methyltransferase [Balneolaceae bacterium]|nr:RNA methyltransferase [Balneolaceae bacterium]MBO6544799.1 RNA methyltransferase [Balneolaceae bacterium]MBO6646195.1 RNA methyltransferase [Balneolaceae bacterium]
MKEASKAQIKLLRKLSQRKYRENEQLFIVEGERAVEQVLENGVIEVESIFVKENKTDSYKQTADCFILSKSIFHELSDTETPQGVIAVCKMPDPVTLEELQKLNSGVIVATDAIQDPGNLGTIIRTASWFGSEALLHGKGTVDVFNPKVVRSTAGATGVLPFISGDLDYLLGELETSGWNVLLLDGNPGAATITSIPKKEKTVLVVGNEANGVSASLITPKRRRTLIPSVRNSKVVESLNAAVALSIALWSVNN